MERYRVTDCKGFELAQWSPADTDDFEGGKAEGRAELKDLTPRLAELQEKFYADGRHKLLVVAHDFLWRVHPQVPSNGQIAIFDRSHYEDVLIVRVHDLVPETRWQARYAHIRAFEKMLADEGTVIFKFFLHISEDEQAERLRARLDLRYPEPSDDLSGVTIE